MPSVYDARELNMNAMTALTPTITEVQYGEEEDCRKV